MTVTIDTKEIEILENLEWKQPGRFKTHLVEGSMNEGAIICAVRGDAAKSIKDAFFVSDAVETLAGG